MCPDYAVYLQLGDGDVLAVGTAGDVAARPLPADERSFANETASLAAARVPSRPRPGASASPAADFRVQVVSALDDAPSLVLLTTDGYPNSFADDAGFRKAATDLLSLCRSEGCAYVEGQLPVWLAEASRAGSGDDATVALIVRAEGLFAAQLPAGHSERTTRTPAGDADHPQGVSPQLDNGAEPEVP